MYQGDTLILILLSAGILVLLLYRMHRWLTAPLQPVYRIGHDAEIPASEAVELLEFAGYEVIAAKRKIPIAITWNDQEALESRLFVDYFAREQDKVYAVKLAKERKPLERTGSGIRDHLLIYQLLYAETEGVLYVDLRQRSIDKFCFHLDNE